MRPAFVLAVVLLTGCAPDEVGSDVPMETDGPNQVVVKVPGMTCASCPTRVAEALASLPWVEAESIVADRRTRQARFTVKDRGQFDLDAVKDVVRKGGYAGTKLLAGPTER